METPSEDAAQVSVHAHVAVRVPSPSTTDRTDVFHIVMKINLFPSLLFYVQKHEKYLSDHFSLQPNSKKVKAVRMYSGSDLSFGAGHKQKTSLANRHQYANVVSSKVRPPSSTPHISSAECRV